MFVAYRQFASASGTEELKAVSVRLPSGAKTAPDGTEVYPARVWTTGAELLVLPGYFSSTRGAVWSGNTGATLKRMSPNKNLQVSLKIYGKQRCFLVHRITASTFLSSIRHLGQTEVDHIDVDHQNGALANLRWATRSQNVANKCVKRKKAANARLSTLLSRAVQQLCPKNGSVIKEFPSLLIATAAMGLSKNAINNCVTGRSPTAGGFAWRMSPPETTLDEFRSRGFEVVGGIAEAPHFYFSSDLKVYHDGLGKMYEIPIAHGATYPIIAIVGKSRAVHTVVAALRARYKSLVAFDDFCATRLRDDGERVVVMHDDDEDKKNFWNCEIGTQKENALAAVRNGCNKGRKKPRAVVIRLSPAATGLSWKYDGANDAVFSSIACAALALAKYSSLKSLSAGISHSVCRGCSFALKNGEKAWAFAV